MSLCGYTCYTSYLKKKSPITHTGSEKKATLNLPWKNKTKQRKNTKAMSSPALLS